MSITMSIISAYYFARQPEQVSLENPVTTGKPKHDEQDVIKNTALPTATVAKIA